MEIFDKKQPGLSIVIADDEPAIRETASFILKDHGYQVFTACSGKEALETIQKERPKIAMLDIRMPDGEGPDICRNIKQDPNLAATFVIILTSNVREIDKIKAIESGADAFLTKPFNESEIISLLDRAIKD